MKQFILAILIISFLFASDQIPAPRQDHPILLKDVTIHPVSGPILTQGEILFSDGKIIEIGHRISRLPENTEIISLPGKHVYPGMIAANTVLGLVEVNAVRATRDFAEVGSFNPNVRAEVSYNPDSELIPVTRSNGVAIVLTVPQSGLISGTSAAMMLDGWTWEDATLKMPVGMHIRWPRMTVSHSRYVRKSPEEQKKERDKQLKELDEILDKARAYAQSISAEKTPHQKMDLKWQSMVNVVKGELPVFIHANGVQQIEAAAEWASRQKLNMVLVGGRDAWMVTDILKKNNIPVIIEATHKLPARRWANYDESFKTPLILYEAEVKFCISANGGAFQAAHQRNLPYEAATAAAYGLPKDEALKSVTLYPAEILGIADQVGSLEVGKDATLFISDGDPLEIMTRVEQLYIQGRKVDMGDRHKILRDKYTEKYRQLGLID
ncbi:MAG: amidohydrolase family protein [Candidatus Marinimicrobia bacterium]|nr:amidohydrolase family protein [Candidatus Neomarinimicrobiota bacterium]